MSSATPEPDRPRSMDPLAGVRAAGDPDHDVFLTGTVFLDIVFTGMDHAPVRGTESWARGMGSSPGGIANMAAATARLGLRTALAAAFGDDVYGDYCWESLADAEGVDLGPSRRFPGWHSPVTVSMAYEGERTMVTHEHQSPTPAAPEVPPAARAGVATFEPDRATPWIGAMHAAGGLVFGDTGWDDTGRWDLDAFPDLKYCHAFLPNSEEARRYTGTDTAEAAARRLAERVPIAVVTRGAEGAVAVDSVTGEEADVPGLRVEALDPTGAGDVFLAGFMTGTLAGWPLADRLAFANLTAALSVQHFGGSLAAPGWPEIASWWEHVSHCPGPDCGGADGAVRRRYAFLSDLLPQNTRPGRRRRAVPTVGFRAA